MAADRGADADSAERVDRGDARDAADAIAAAARALGADGALGRYVEGFAPRPQQQRMAKAVATALVDDDLLVVEAGTGTGKTFAYLVPALLSGKKIIVSTGTRNLQDQLFHKDLPVVRRALALPVRTALLKGRSNYLCRYRLGTAEGEGLVGRIVQHELAEISDWAGRTRSGDIAEVGSVPEDSPLWPRLTSTLDNCLGSECPAFGECFVVKARRAALEADVVVINHHLFCADMAIKEEGFGEILPGADAFIIDEAHQLPDVAAQFFGQTLSSRQLIELARDTRVEQRRDAADFPDLARRAEAVERAVAELRLALGRDAGRQAWPPLARRPAVAGRAQDLAAALERLADALAEAAARGKGLESCHDRCDLLRQRFVRFCEPQPRAPLAPPDGWHEADADARVNAADTATAADRRADDGEVRWIDLHSRGFGLHLTPLSVGSFFRSRMTQFRSAWVFTSATLAVADGFSHFTDRLGLSDPSTLTLDSPFDYARNALLYHPKNLPEPSSPDYNRAVFDAALPVLQASRGRAFVLFTSHQALREAAGWLTREDLSYPLLVQGERPKTELLERFRRAGDAILLGTSSFWEGVDVRGEALSCVIIAKLPFAAPNDPVLQARSEALRRAGGNPFMQLQVPQAVIALKQGVGRLIRDVDDRGVLMLCDPRLLSKPYGKLFLRSLPPMPRTRSLAQVQTFFDGVAAGAAVAEADAAGDRNGAPS